MLHYWLYTGLLLLWDAYYCSTASTARSAPPDAKYRMIMLERLSYVIVLSVYGYYLAVQELVIFLIVVLLLSAAEAQFHKILATVAPRYDFSVESSK